MKRMELDYCSAARFSDKARRWALRSREEYERGKASHILERPWQTDDSIGSWDYNENTPYTSSDAVVDKIIDIVRKKWKYAAEHPDPGRRHAGRNGDRNSRRPWPLV